MNSELYWKPVEGVQGRCDMVLQVMERNLMNSKIKSVRVTEPGTNKCKDGFLKVTTTQEGLDVNKESKLKKGCLDKIDNFF